MYAKAKNNSEAGKFVQEEDILKVLSLIEEAENKQQTPIVLGDFNSDLYRLNQYDKIFDKYTRQYGFKS